MLGGRVFTFDVVGSGVVALGAGLERVRAIGIFVFVDSIGLKCGVQCAKWLQLRSIHCGVRVGFAFGSPQMSNASRKLERVPRLKARFRLVKDDLI